MCIDCRKCEKVCPASIRITSRRAVRNCECIGCLECVSACPVPGCLGLALPAGRKSPLFLIPLGAVATFLFFWAVASLTGHWNSSVPVEVFQRIYKVWSVTP